ncbi:MAG: hypothetical protein ACRD7E_24695 [Bryobacteraceae bacterium]
MDTRQKIFSSDEAAEAINRGRRLTAIAGNFDPLQSSHARRLAEIRREGHSMAVILTDSAHPILPQRARAELVAALRVVDYVVLSQNNTLAEVIDQLSPDEVIHEEEADQHRLGELVSHVWKRHNTR